MVESSYKMRSTGEGNGKPLQHSCLENSMNSMKWQKDRTLKDAYIWNLKKKWYRCAYLQNRNRVTDVENKLTVTKGIVEKDKLGGWN